MRQTTPAFSALSTAAKPWRIPLNIPKNTPTSVYDLFASYISKIPVFLWKSKRVEEKIRVQLAKFKAEDLIDKAVCDLSGGELQRVLLSLATYKAPNL